MIRKTLVALAFTSLATLSGPVFASDDECRSVPRSEWRSMEDAVAAVTGMGYAIREIEVDDGCYEVKATGKEGGRVKLYLDPGTLEVVRRRDRS